MSVDLAGEKPTLDTLLFPFPFIDPTRLLNALEEVSGEVESLGSKEVRGVDTEGYRLSIDLRRAIEEAPAAHRKALLEELEDESPEDAAGGDLDRRRRLRAAVVPRRRGGRGHGRLLRLRRRGGRGGSARGSGRVGRRLSLRREPRKTTMRSAAARRRTSSGSRRDRARTDEDDRRRAQDLALRLGDAASGRSRSTRSRRPSG